MQMNKTAATQKRTAKKHARTKLPYLLYFFIVALAFTAGYTYSRMKTMSTGNDSIGVAKPVVEVSRSSYSDEVYIYEPGLYCFLVKNYNEDKITDTAMQYEVVAASNEEYSGSVFFRLYRSDSTYSSKYEIDGSNNRFTDAQMTLGIAENQTHYYILEFYPDTDGEITITVDVVAVQIV